VQVLIAAEAELLSKGRMVDAVNGASWEVAASQREKYALKERWSTLHLLVSQPSYMILLVKKTVEAFRRPVVWVRQTSLPFVFPNAS